jgi:hypothetical protein
MKVIKEMFEASVDGQPYDTERWGQYFRPAGVQAPGGAKGGDEAAAPAATETKAAPAPAAASSFDDEEDAPIASAPVTKPAASGQSAQDLLAMIRSRQATK